MKEYTYIPNGMVLPRNFNFEKFNELMNIIADFLQENGIIDDVSIKVDTPHDAFRQLDGDIRQMLEDTTLKPSEGQFGIKYADNLNVLVHDVTNDIIAQTQESNG